MQGIITKSTGKFYSIMSDDGQLYHDAIIRGKFKLGNFKLTNPVAVGDLVSFHIIDSAPIIEEIHPRRNYVVRQSPRKKHFLHLLASNIDQAVLIVTIKGPLLKQGFIDRFLLMTEPYDIPVIILFNKSDLWDEPEKQMFLFLKNIYQTIGYHTLRCSTLTADNIEEIKELLYQKTTLIAGQSGVGKSSLINAIIPDLQLTTQELSDYSGKGQHTTTFAEMFSINPQSKIIDTPGIKTLSFNHLEVMDVAHNFREFFVAATNCRFADCTHRNEPHCAVKEEIADGTISELRYLNYLQILEEIENQNYWELIKEY